jgi:long-chain acyl-CoA synthetase
MIGPIDSMMRRWWRHEDPVLPQPDQTEAERQPDSPPTSSEPWLATAEQAGIPTSLTYPSTTLARLLDQTADRFGDSPAVFYEQETWTYRELLAAVNRAAGALAALGVRRGERIVLALPNCPEFLTTFLGCQKLGAIVVNVGPLMGADDLSAVIALTRPRVAIGLDLQSAMMTRADETSAIEHWVWVSLRDYQPMLKRLGYQYKLWHGGRRNGHGGHHASYDELIDRAPARPPTVVPQPDDIALLQPTGGTTGTLKLAELSHRNLVSNAAQVDVWMNARQGQDRILAVLPMFHVYGLTLNLIAAVYSASSIVLCTRFHCERVIELIRRHRPTVFPLVPAICEAISDRLESEDPGPAAGLLAGLRLCISGSAPLPSAVAERFQRLTGATVIEGYGLTEAAPVTHANLPGRARAGSIGLPMPDTKVRVVDLDDPARDVGLNEPGEMLVSGPQVMHGYFSSPEQTAMALSRDDDGTVWLHTGDVVQYDDDGFFHVLDRKKDMIIRSGLKVYPARVERVLRMHPQVVDAAVIGRADRVHTQTVVALIVVNASDNGQAKEGHEQLIDELRSLCREHLAPYEVPSDFEFVEGLPRSALGKLLRRELRDPPAPNPGPNGKPHKKEAA